MIGANGAGKSTLLRTIAGLHQRAPAPCRSGAATSTDCRPTSASRWASRSSPRGVGCSRP